MDKSIPTLELHTTNNFSEIKLLAKPSKKSVTLHNDIGSNYLHYKILENKYESITFQNLTVKRHNTIKSPLFTYINGIPTYADIPIYPAMQGMDTNILKSITYPGGLKYYNMVFSSYWQNIENKTIVIIKQIGPKEIIGGKLYLYFNEEHFLRQKNKVKTLFCYSDWGISPKTWDSISETDFDYEIIINITKIKKASLKADLVIIDKISIHRKYTCIDDIVIIPTHMVLFYKCCVSISPGASIVLLQAMPWSEAHVQLFYYIRTVFFKDIIYKKSKLSSIKNGQFIFSGFSACTSGSANLKQLITKYIKLDKDLGYSLYLPIRKTYCNVQQKMPEGKITDIMIAGIFSNIIPDHFMKFINTIYKKRKQAEKSYNTKITYLHSILADITTNRALQKMQNFIHNNIEDSLSYISKKGFQRNTIYDNNVIPNPLQLIKKVFPGVKTPTDLLLSRDSVYSISSYSVAERTSAIIKKHFPRATSVIDGCANIGGNTYSFSKNFRFVIANEMQESTYNNLANNVSVLQLKNIYVVNEDITKLIKNKEFLARIKYDPETYVLYLDPPWSGVWYQLQDTIELFLGDVNVLSFIKNISVRYICLKVPKNFDMRRLFDEFANVVIYKVEYCYIIIITK